MRGFDERESDWQHVVKAHGQKHIEELTRESIAGAVARGWCADVNSHKVFDGDLAVAITRELLALAPNVGWQCPECGRPTDIQVVHCVDFTDAGLAARKWRCDQCAAIRRLEAENQRLRDYRDSGEAALV